MNYKNLTDSIIPLAKKTGHYQMSMLGLLQEDMIEAKGKMDFVTDVDKQSEKQLLDGLSLLIPESGFIAEEGTYTHKGPVFNWIVDPLDGTTNFIHGVSPFSISIESSKYTSSIGYYNIIFSDRHIIRHVIMTGGKFIF